MNSIDKGEVLIHTHYLFSHIFLNGFYNFITWFFLSLISARSDNVCTSQAKAMIYEHFSQ